LIGSMSAPPLGIGIGSAVVSTENLPPCTIDLDGSQTVRFIQTTYERLSAALAQHQVVDIRCDGIAEFDLSFIQLLLAAKRSAHESGKALRLTSPATGKLRLALDRAGFLTGAAEEPNQSTAFWLEGSNAS
jgi:ABC-type transporter Mla MlaB component